MSNRESNYPTTALDKMNGSEFTGKTVSSIMELSTRGKPQTVAELKERLAQYFSFCEEHRFRPGIETLSLSLGVSRQTFWAWCTKDSGKDSEWREACQQARQIVISFLEQSALCGHLSPPVSIFLLKNLASYKDVVSFDEVPQTQDNNRVLSGSDLPNLSKYLLSNTNKTNSDTYHGKDGEHDI